MKFESTKIIELGSCAFRQWKADSHCKFIHGYRLVAKFWFECDSLDEKNWVVDFGGLKELKQVLERQFDHTLCIAADDPLRHEFEQLHKLGAADLRIMEKGVGIERTADWCFDVADAHIRGITKNRCWVKQVEVWEHDKNSAIASLEYTRVPAHNPYVAPEAQPVATRAVPDVSIATTVNAGINVEKQLAAEQATSPLGSQIEHIPLKKEIRAAPVGNKVTTGYSNLFAGTSWGK